MTRFRHERSPRRDDRTAAPIGSPRRAGDATAALGRSWPAWCLFAAVVGACGPAAAPTPTPPDGACAVVGSVGTPEEGGALYASEGRPLVVVGVNPGTAFACECVGERRLGGATEDRRLGGDTEDRRLGGDTEDRRLGGDTEDRRLGGDTEDRRLGGDTEDRRLGGDTEDRRLGGDTEDRRLGGDTEDRRLGGDTEDRRLGGAVATVTCRPLPDGTGYELRGVAAGASVVLVDADGARAVQGNVVLY